MTRNLVETLEWLADRQAANDHDPVDAECRERIEHRGGKIQSWRSTEPAVSRRFEQRKDN
ncbi:MULTISPECIES: hypothetical protein [unclassified Mesorhizobium]|uniref:hypothetical protein n=1 Tax=unclassified Mesorhizobium TaxID=325217 RepID=UPI000FCCC597|nr:MULTISPECIES: hypothetical protein [unclassified Mesorhizobium]TGU07856.1 hypothetical protein EN806_31420 [bacterium M00.F.Ca.ET.163.01.1.1]TGU47062.1 hypothetical protein EN789_13595 [bacterium M00.F.Ca.ET.146.01.1.1]TGW12710.1 hypothetical protein EN788_08110 [Mesorhizobium sp. M2D.F.Ca.ET.145.01.1.1]TGP33328.1 hypothetical protein EN875_015410 [Mesorhizobium sp. M2D.F.Ca.ET.232.01.1.1]TGP59374.1 hypothetical protein EN869_013930 [Mesorhizobium sp. M2D.F.Ca.ET.226.01.1.1]